MATTDAASSFAVRVPILDRRDDRGTFMRCAPNRARSSIEGKEEWNAAQLAIGPKTDSGHLLLVYRFAAMWAPSPMTLLLALLVLRATFAGTASPQEGSVRSAQPFSITINLSTPEVKSGSPVELRIKLTNTSDHPMNSSAVYTEGVNLTFEYEVQKLNGTPLGEICKNVGGCIRTVIVSKPLEPGQSREDGTVVSNLYDMREPGQYAVQLSRLIDGGDASRGRVKSNKVTVTVTP